MRTSIEGRQWHSFLRIIRRDEGGRALMLRSGLNDHGVRVTAPAEIQEIQGPDGPLRGVISGPCVLVMVLVVHDDGFGHNLLWICECSTNLANGISLIFLYSISLKRVINAPKCSLKIPHFTIIGTVSIPYLPLLNAAIKSQVLPQYKVNSLGYQA